MAEEDHHNNGTTGQKCDQDLQEEKQNQLSFNFNNITVPFPVSVTATPPSSPRLKLKTLETPPYKVEKNDSDDDLECPGAPRKEIMRLPSPMKQNATCCSALMFDLPEEVESMFTISFEDAEVSVTATPPSSPYEVPEKNENDDDLNDGFKAPTTLSHKIQPMLECPGAPRKEITRLPSPMKRNATCRSELVFDMPEEMESMFTISFKEDLNDVKNKKL